jgi:hypothetical protein
VAEVPSNPSRGHRRTTSGSFDCTSKGSTWSARARSSSPVNLPRDSDTPHSLTTAIRSIRQGFRLRWNFRSVHEGSVPRSMHSHLPLLRLIMACQGANQSCCRNPAVHCCWRSHRRLLESLQSFSKLPLGSSPVPSQ